MFCLVARALPLKFQIEELLYLLLAAKKGQDQVGVVIFTVQTLQ